MSDRFLLSMVSIFFGVMCGAYGRMYAEMLWQHNADASALVWTILLLLVAVVFAAVAASE